MTRTSKALRRLGVAGLAAVTIGAGVPALVSTAAQAAAGPTTQLAVTPSTQSGAAGTCIRYTVTPQDAAGTTSSDAATQTITVEVTTTSTNSVTFCDVTRPFANSGTTSNPATALVPATTARQTGQTDTNGNYVFGIRSNAPGGANIRAFIGSGSFQAGQINRTATATFTAGGNNTSDNQSGGNAAQDAVKTITEVPQSANANPVVAGTSADPNTTQFVTVQLKNTAGDPVSGVTVNAVFSSNSANAFQPASGNTASQPAAAITCVSGGTTTNSQSGVTTAGAAVTADNGTQGASVSNNNGFVTCHYTAARAGSDTITVFVNQTTGSTAGPDNGEPQLTVTRTTAAAPNRTVSEARNIDLKPEGPIDTTSGTARVFTATVTDATGKPVEGVTVTFSIQGTAGTLSNTTGTTNGFGSATTSVTTVQGQTGQATVTAAISSAGTQCNNLAGAPAGTTTNGNCSDAEVTNFVAASPSASPSATSTATASPSASASTGTCTAAQGNLPVRVNTPTINATGLASVTITGAPANGTVELQGYSQNHYGTANFTNDPTPIDRTVTAGSDGSVTISDLRPASNTRIRARVRGCQFGTGALGSVINVRTQLTLAARRTGTRTVVISGGSIPARPGGLIVGIYRGNTLIGQARASQTSGQYSVTLHFPASDQGQRINLTARTGQDAQNAPGQSNVRSLLIT
jgi:adhesin/invasin